MFFISRCDKTDIPAPEIPDPEVVRDTILDTVILEKTYPVYKTLKSTVRVTDTIYKVDTLHETVYLTNDDKLKALQDQLLTYLDAQKYEYEYEDERVYITESFIVGENKVYDFNRTVLHHKLEEAVKPQPVETDPKWYANVGYTYPHGALAGVGYDIGKVRLSVNYIYSDVLDSKHIGMFMVSVPIK